MSSRLLSVLGLGLVVLPGACSGQDMTADTDAPPAKAAPKFTKFADFRE